MKGKCKISNNQNLEKTILPSEKGVGGMVLIHIFETVSSSPKRPAFIFPPCFSVILREGIKRKKKKNSKTLMSFSAFILILHITAMIMAAISKGLTVSKGGQRGSCLYARKVKPTHLTSPCLHAH